MEALFWTLFWIFSPMFMVAAYLRIGVAFARSQAKAVYADNRKRWTYIRSAEEETRSELLVKTVFWPISLTKVVAMKVMPTLNIAEAAFAPIREEQEKLRQVKEDIRHWKAERNQALRQIELGEQVHTSQEFVNTANDVISFLNGRERELESKYGSRDDYY